MNDAPSVESSVHWVFAKDSLRNPTFEKRTTMLTLYFSYISPYSRKVRVVLAEKGLEFKPELTHFANAPTKYPAVNPCRRVPVLVDGDRALFESNVILDYLLQTFPDAVGSDAPPPLSKRLVRPEHHWDDWQTLVGIETMLDSGLNLLQMRNNKITPAQSEYLTRELNRTGIILDWLEQRATPEGFIPGEFSILDLNFVISVQWAEFRDIFEWRGRPTLEKIVARYQERESMRTTVPESKYVH